MQKIIGNFIIAPVIPVSICIHFNQRSGNAKYCYRKAKCFNQKENGWFYHQPWTIFPRKNKLFPAFEFNIYISMVDIRRMCIDTYTCLCYTFRNHRACPLYIYLWKLNLLNFSLWRAYGWVAMITIYMWIACVVLRKHIASYSHCHQCLKCIRTQTITTGCCFLIVSKWKWWSRKGSIL